jgi:GNAT superfamily N-acetyltransferase
MEGGVRSTVRIRSVRSDDAERLRELTVESKAHWGYDRSWVEAWVAGGDFSAATLAANETFVAEADGAPVGWAMVVRRDDVAWLEDMWVDPPWIGKGVGTLLFARVVARARELGARRLEWEAEPNAVGFYEKLGGRYVRESETNEWGRILTVMGLDVGDR